MPRSPGRRRFMGTMSLAGLGGLTPAPVLAAAPATQARSEGGSIQIGTGVTRALARYVVSAGYADVPAAVRKEARRTLLNWMGCAVGGSRHETLDAAIAALTPFSGPPQAIGARPARADGRAARGADERHQLARLRFRRHASQDRHPSGRPGGVGAARAGGVPSGSRAREFLQRAWCSASRPNAASATPSIPPHYDRGWHITGTAGVFGAAAACGKAARTRPSSRWSGRWGSPPPSRSACARCSDR